MNYFQRFKLFQKAVVAVTALFFGLMGLVIIAAYTRHSGSTGLDMAKIQKMRYDSQIANRLPESVPELD